MVALTQTMNVNIRGRLELDVPTCQTSLVRNEIMNWDQIAGNWKQFKGNVKEKWGKLTDDDLTVIAGKRDQLTGLLQQKYGYAKDKAEQELDEFMKAVK